MFRQKLTEMVKTWRLNGMPGRTSLMEIEAGLSHWRMSGKVPGLWDTPPVLVTATLDDGLGNGIHLVGRYAALCGAVVHPIGLCVPPKAILAACETFEPDILCLTVLRDDQEDALLEIRNALPVKTRIIVGGPIAVYDPELAERVGIDHMSRNLIDFLEFLIALPPSGNDTAMDPAQPGRGIKK